MRVTTALALIYDMMRHVTQGKGYQSGDVRQPQRHPWGRPRLRRERAPPLL